MFRKNKGNFSEFLETLKVTKEMSFGKHKIREIHENVK